MARNEEKTNAMLNKWLSMKQEHATGGPEQYVIHPLKTTIKCAYVYRSYCTCRRRPYLASECNSLPDAEKFRRQIIGEIMRKVTTIQNGASFDSPRPF